MLDMSAEAITARLKLACELGRREPRPAKVPMDAASVTARLKSASELRDLCLRLGQWARSNGESEPK
jgi:hypothetical protein